MPAMSVIASDSASVTSDRDAMKISFQPDEEARIRLEPDAETAARKEGEVVIVMGIQGAGKTSFVERAADHLRLNRDQRGGSLADLLPPLREALAGPNPRVILDNTYPTRVSRWPVVRAARAAGVRARCVHVATSPRDALINVVNRVIDRYDRLLGPDELKELGKTDPNLPPPAALQRYVATFEPPGADEGFDSIETIPFARRPGGGEARGLLLDVDGTLRVTRSGDPYPVDPDDIVVLPGRTEVLRRWIADGYRLFFVSNQSGVASGKLSAEAARACFDRTIALLDVPVDEVAFCPHPAFPAGCFCRKPMPGMGVWLARRHGLDLSRTVMVGDMDTDRGFADALGVAFQDAEGFFAGASGG
jgi:HAD superfamily hydrolase (TIGR01662 family)